MDKQSIGIIGYGKLGRTLAGKLLNSKRLKWVCSAGACDKVPQAGKCYKSISDISELADIIFITKADKYIEETAEELAEIFANNLNGRIIIHCSGLLPKDILQSCEKNGAITARAHPYQTFFEPLDCVLHNVFWTIDAGEHFKVVNSIIKELGGTSVNTSKKDDFNAVLYHASAVVASNYMNTIIALAAETAKISGIEPSDFLPRIMDTTLANIINAIGKDNEFPLTGPIARGDIITIEKHIAGLKPHSSLLREYCRIGLSTVELAYGHNYISEIEYKTMKNLLQSNID